MGILSRCSGIIAANIHALLDEAENPETMIGQVVREMDDRLAAARGHAAQAIAAERRLNRELIAQRADIEDCQSKARATVAAGRDDLARIALARKKEAENSAAELARQHALALEANAQVRAALQTLEADLASALRKQRSIVARFHAARARQLLLQTAVTRIGISMMPSANWQRWQRGLTDLEELVAAEVEVHSLHPLDGQLAAWETEMEIERDLAELKNAVAAK